METAEDLYTEDFEENEVEANGEHLHQENGQEPGDEAQGGTEGDESKQPVKPKKVIRRPRPKLNAETLKGKRGLTALESYFDRVKYKGHGHEEEDLSVILKTYEYWCHRLFPKYPFDECISKIEQLGKKRPVLTHIKKIRLDMIYEDEPAVPNDDDLRTDEIGINEFDDLLEVPRVQQSVDIDEEQLERIRLNKERAERIRREKFSQRMESTSQELEGPQELTSSPEKENTSHVSETQPTTSVSEEQLERIRLNKERAEKIRKEKLKERRKLSLPEDSPNLSSDLNNSPRLLEDDDAQMESILHDVDKTN